MIGSCGTPVDHLPGFTSLLVYLNKLQHSLRSHEQISLFIRYIIQHRLLPPFQYCRVS